MNRTQIYTTIKGQEDYMKISSPDVILDMTPGDFRDHIQIAVRATNQDEITGWFSIQDLEAAINACKVRWY